jgi:hypothetical protein
MQIGVGASYSGGTSLANFLEVGANFFADSGGVDKYIATSEATKYRQVSGVHSWYTSPSGTAGNTITFTQAMTLDHVSAATTLKLANSSSGATATDGFDLVSAGVDSFVVNRENGRMAFYTNNSERARITSGGDLLVAKTASSLATVGFEALSSGPCLFTANQDAGAYVNRLNNDGDLIRFYQDTALEGSISVSGNTVSYNAFAGSHWSQLQDGSKPDILRGTVMESINELCVWEGEDNERLPKCKISDTAGSKKVYGVFMAWDNDWTETNDMYVTAVGAFICRVNASVTVQEGDLLESNGDGTARVQADDLIRSSTIGKVTSTVKTHEYDDGSYCVPTVLYCG